MTCKYPAISNTHTHKDIQNYGFKVAVHTRKTEQKTKTIGINSVIQVRIDQGLVVKIRCPLR